VRQPGQRLQHPQVPLALQAWAQAGAVYTVHFILFFNVRVVVLRQRGLVELVVTG
jgi:hypothetical protein